MVLNLKRLPDQPIPMVAICTDPFRGVILESTNLDSRAQECKRVPRQQERWQAFNGALVKVVVTEVALKSKAFSQTA